MNAIVNCSRRSFLKSSALAGGGLILGVYIPGLRNSVRAADQPASTVALNAFVRIAPDETVTVVVNHSELGQGPYTSIPMVVAEELDADWNKVRYEAAPVDPAYNHTIFGMQMTGGSTSTWTEWERVRKAGAAARQMLVTAAAKTWKVEPANCRTENGFVISPMGQRASYGSLVEKAWKLEPPQNVAVKNQKDFKLVGKPTKRLDTPDKTNGKAMFGIDVNALSSAAKKFEAVYDLPYLAHATMEPMNCVADVRGDSCEIWVGTQFQTVDRDAAAKETGLKPEQVKLHTMLCGGGFGRRAVPDSHFVVEAVQISKTVKAPVKVIWMREDDMRGGWYRPRAYHAVSAGLSADGKPIAWQQRIVSQSIVADTPFKKYVVKEGVDETAVEGAKDIPYEIPNLLVDWHKAPAGVPVLWWRSVGHSHTAFVVETFIDELAHAAGKDPFEFRRELLTKHPRHKRVLEFVAEKAGWGKPLPLGRGRGIALHESFESYVAHVAEVSVKDGKVRVHRIVAAIDCGRVVNPDTVQAQLQSGAVFGLTAALYGEISFESGRVKQRNFHDYPMLRMHEMPEVEAHIVPGEEKMGGVGEPAQRSETKRWQDARPNHPSRR